MSLRTIRRAKDITQEQLASASGVDQTTISDLERGKNRNPSWESVRRLAMALSTPPEELFPIDCEVVALGDVLAEPERRSAERRISERREA